MIYEAFLIKIQTKCSFQSINRYKPIQFWEQLHPKPPQVRASPAGIKFVYSLATVEDLYRRVHYAYVHGILFLYAFVDFFFSRARSLSLSLVGFLVSGLVSWWAQDANEVPLHVNLVAHAIAPEPLSLQWVFQSVLGVQLQIQIRAIKSSIGWMQSRRLIGK